MPGRGRAMFAARDINVGEVVLSEKPVVTMSDQAYDEPDFEFRVSKQVWNLEPAQVAHFMDLYVTPDYERKYNQVLGSLLHQLHGCQRVRRHSRWKLLQPQLQAQYRP